MGVALVVDTKKRAAILQSDTKRRDWNLSFVLKGWHVTGSMRDDLGRSVAAE